MQRSIRHHHTTPAQQRAHLPRPGRAWARGGRCWTRSGTWPL